MTASSHFLAAMLLFAGHETTVVRIDLGTLLLLTNPGQREALHRDPSLVTNAVEEILRASATGGGGLPRYPRADIEIGGVTLRAGDAVMLDLGAANHDERAFREPDRFDITRRPNPHLAFGHGPRFCTGRPPWRSRCRKPVSITRSSRACTRGSAPRWNGAEAPTIAGGCSLASAGA